MRWFLLAFLVAGCTFTGTIPDYDTDTPITVECAEVETFAFLGDSLTAGTASSYTYIDLLPHKIGLFESVGHVDAGDYYHDAISGTSSRAALPQVDTWTSTWSACPDHAVIWYGTVDAIYRFSTTSTTDDVPVTETMSNIDAIADDIEILCPDVQVWFPNVLPGGGSTYGSAAYAAEVSAHNAAMPGLVTSSTPNRHVVTVSDGYAATMAPDWIHYGRLGADVVAGNLADAIYPPLE